MIPVFLNRDSEIKNVDEILKDRDLTKILKIEIKRIKSDDEFVTVFVVNDISKFF